MTEFEAIIVPERGRITFLGTPQTEESVYMKLRERGYDCRIWPARYPTLDKIEAYKGSLAPTIQDQIEKQPDAVIGKPVDPRRFGNDELLERLAAMGKTNFTLQFMLDTTLSDQERYPLKLKDLVVLDLNLEKAPIQVQYASGPEQIIKELGNCGFSGDRFCRPMWMSQEWAPYEGRVMSIDPSGRGADETGFAIVFQLHGNLFLMNAGGLKGGYSPENLHILAKFAKAYKVNEIVVESNFGDGMFTALFQPVLQEVYPQCGVVETRSGVQKEKRICDTLEPVMGTHRLIINRSLVETDLKVCGNTQKHSLLYQMTRITRDRGALRHDDRLDAVEMAVRYWLDSLGRNETKAADEWKARLLEDDLKAFMDNCLLRKCNQIGDKPNPLKWV